MLLLLFLFYNNKIYLNQFFSIYILYYLHLIMKLTKIHIFLILLVALVLCSTLGMCLNQGVEGFSNRSDDKRTYESYSDYNTQKNDDNIRSVNHADKKSSNYNNPFYNKANWNKDKSKDNEDDDDDRSSMNTKKPKYSRYRDSSDRDSHNRVTDRIAIFDSVAKGNVNGSTYNIKETITKENDGIPRNRIPRGQENLYILKSEIVPPICPACPNVNCNNNNNSESKKCQPCPACARCPEPSFECKKVPNYNSTNLMNQLPIPWASKL